MTKKITTKGALHVGIDVLFLALYLIGGAAGIMYAGVLQDFTAMFFYGAGAFLILQALEIFQQVTKPLDNYETQDVV